MLAEATSALNLVVLSAFFVRPNYVHSFCTTLQAKEDPVERVFQ
jgi:hypothetical protein